MAPSYPTAKAASDATQIPNRWRLVPDDCVVTCVPSIFPTPPYSVENHSEVPSCDSRLTRGLGEKVKVPVASFRGRRQAEPWR